MKYSVQEEAKIIEKQENYYRKMLEGYKTDQIIGSGLLCNLKDPNTNLS